MNIDELNQAPAEMEDPETPEIDFIDPNLEEQLENSLENNPNDTLEPHRPFRPTSPNKPVLRTNDVLAPTPEGPSKFIQIAYWVIKNERSKIGTACNFYVSRVLELAGYSDDSFIANDFDRYAKKNFTSQKTATFITTKSTAEKERLKSYLWSFPERTPFILNWERSAPRHGHIAIIERMGNTLVVFQASMNKHLAERKETTVDNILNYSRQAKLTVYSHFKP